MLTDDGPCQPACDADRRSPPRSDDHRDDDALSVDTQVGDSGVGDSEVIAEDAERVNVVTVVLVYDDGLFGHSCVTDVGVKGVSLQAIRSSSEAFGNLNDQYTWGVLRKAMGSDVVDGMLFTPSAATYIDTASEFLDAWRSAEGQGIYGLPHLPQCIFAEELRREDLHWHRTAEEARNLLKLGKPWAVIYQRAGE